jgi:hypothetical protein
LPFFREKSVFFREKLPKRGSPLAKARLRVVTTAPMIRE